MHDSVVSSSELWGRVRERLGSELDSQIFAAYVKPLQAVQADDDNELLVVAPSKLVCSHVDRKFRKRIEEIVIELAPEKPMTIRFKVDSSLEGEQPQRSSIVIKKHQLASKPAVKLQGPTVSPGLNPKYTFDNFVVGTNNQFCHAAAMRVAEEPGQSYNPLFIYGGVGLGKTHLLHAIGNSVLSLRPDARVLYMSSETFTNELIQSLRHAKMDEFKNKLRNIEVLLIDDIQFMCGKERTQEEFFHTFNALYSSRHQIVITSDKLPQEIPGIEDRLKTRFAWGLAADLQAPDFETRVAILRRKATLESFELPRDVANFIAERISSNVRELEGALTRLHAVSSLQNKKISMELAESALKPLMQPKVVIVSVDEIKKVVADHFGIKVSEMVSKRRTKNLSFPRHIAMYLCRKHTTCSYPEIGGHFGGRDHSSVIHAANVVSTKIKDNPDVKDHIDALERKLLGR